MEESVGQVLDPRPNQNQLGLQSVDILRLGSPSDIVLCAARVRTKRLLSLTESEGRRALSGRIKYLARFTFQHAEGLRWVCH